MVRAGREAIALGLLLATFGGCKLGQLPGPTEFVLEVHSDLAVPDEMDAIRVRAARADGAFMYDRSDPLGVGGGRVRLPITATFAPLDARSETFRIWVDGMQGAVVVVSRSILTSFVPEKSWLLRISLSRTCMGVVCGDSLTCDQGICVPIRVDPGSPPELPLIVVVPPVVEPTGGGRIDAADAAGTGVDGARSGADGVAGADGVGVAMDVAKGPDVAATGDVPPDLRVLPDLTVGNDVVADVPAAPDVGADLPLGSPDLPRDALPAPDSGPEPGAEPRPEVAPELGPEPSAEPGAEAGPESGAEPGSEPGPEPGAEPGPEPSPDAGIDVPVDAPTDGPPAPDFCVDKPDFTLCNVVTSPDRSYDICVGGVCVSPGCGGEACNVPGPHFRLADTNQRKCYDNSSEMMACPVSCEAFYGQDSQYGWDMHHPASARFTRNTSTANQPVVQDNVTGLAWQGCAAGLSGNDCEVPPDAGAADTPTWQEALAYCDALDWGGHQDWRLPDPHELDSIVDAGRSVPAIDTSAFPVIGMLWNSFWSSSSVAGSPSEAWIVQLAYGESGFGNKNGTANVRCVRGGSPSTAVGFTRNTTVPNQPVVLDNATALVWQGCAAGLNGSACDSDSAGTYTWQGALAYCESLDWGGHQDWRLPDRKVLRSIADNRLNSRAIDLAAFPATPLDNFWSSTSYAGGSGAWCVNSSNGVVASFGKGQTYFVRCVRGGPDTVVEGPGCASLAADCGPSANESCCTAPLVAGGKFYRSYDGVSFTDQSYPATVSDFYLDKFEVTVGRFRKFVEAGAGTQANPPAFGAGAHPLITGSGWYSAWDTSLAADTTALKDAFHSECPGTTTWTDVAGVNEDLPMDCVTWYEAFAFCAWDGGRLPTEAEWNYAAAGGCAQREYPWGAAAPDVTRAVYDFNPLLPVGSKPAGNGMWGQADLAGNVFEWNLDWAGSYVLPCNDCAYITGSASRVLRGGGGGLDSSRLRSSYRGLGAPSFRDVSLGIRCARIVP
jgi:formylglycine-generating enzyme